MDSCIGPTTLSYDTASKIRDPNTLRLSLVEPLEEASGPICRMLIPKNLWALLPLSSAIMDIDTDYKDGEELELETLVFGDQSGFEANLRKIENLYDYSDSDYEHEAPQALDSEDLFYIDEAADDAMDIHQDESDGSEDGAPTRHLLAVWADLDDEKHAISLKESATAKLRKAQAENMVNGVEYVARLRAQYEKIYPRPEWVDKWERPDEHKKAKKLRRDDALDDSDSVSEDEQDLRVGSNAQQLLDILASTSTFVKPVSKTLPSQSINITRLKDANVARRAKSGVLAVHFHPATALLVTGGLDRTLRIYHIDGKKNAFVLSVHFRDTPIAQCQFSKRPGSSMVYAGGRRRHMHRWDMQTGSVEKVSRMYGQDLHQRSYEYFVGSPQGLYIGVKAEGGWVNVVNAVTGQLVRGFKVDDRVADFVFLQDDAVLIVSNIAGEISEFDVHTGRVLRKWADSSAVAVTKIAMGGNDRWLAVGTQSGVVNVFEMPGSKYQDAGAAEGSASAKLVKEIGNLVTPVSSLCFSHDGQILAVASQAKKDAFRLVHMPLANVFPNWPTRGTPLGRVTDVSFSRNGQMMAVANDVGKVTLWRLNHY